ncbi:hypothetical protein EVAR_71239_1 [Eumeta japonica]|uniref:Uncharacterized protein n=1 Tax=Eumeta variegata TaxID=151549 RepID=A0A4C1SAR3_EUMVA|nr:hypothetical protein EVAR_71239_1 [Eumeta japonica]
MDFQSAMETFAEAWAAANTVKSEAPSDLSQSSVSKERQQNLITKPTLFVRLLNLIRIEEPKPNRHSKASIEQPRTLPVDTFSFRKPNTAAAARCTIHTELRAARYCDVVIEQIKKRRSDPGRAIIAVESPSGPVMRCGKNGGAPLVPE